MSPPLRIICLAATLIVGYISPTYANNLYYIYYQKNIDTGEYDVLGTLRTSQNSEQFAVLIRGNQKEIATFLGDIIDKPPTQSSPSAFRHSYLEATSVSSQGVPLATAGIIQPSLSSALESDTHNIILKSWLACEVNLELGDILEYGDTLAANRPEEGKILFLTPVASQAAQELFKRPSSEKSSSTFERSANDQLISAMIEGAYTNSENSEYCLVGDLIRESEKQGLIKLQFVRERHPPAYYVMGRREQLEALKAECEAVKQKEGAPTLPRLN